MSETNKELKQFAEALLDVDRLKIVGELARGSRSISALSKRVGMDGDSVIAHMEILSKTGVVSLQKQADGEVTYLLAEKALEEMSKRQFNRARSLQQREPDMRDIGSQFSPEEQKYIRSFTDRNGIIKHLPALTKKAKLLAVLRYAMQDLVPGQVYSEKDFNQALSRFTRDAASVRRYLVDFGYIDREVDGSAYWLMEGEHD